MTEKELHKLRRQDLLQLLLSQSREVSRQQAVIAELEEASAGLQSSLERLKLRLDEKDALVEKLKSRLNDKDATIQALQAEMEEWLSGRKLELEAQLEEVRQSNELLRDRLSDKDAQIKELKNRVQERDGQSARPHPETDRQRAVQKRETDKEPEETPELAFLPDLQTAPVYEPYVPAGEWHIIGQPGGGVYEGVPGEPPEKNESYMLAPRAIDWNEYSKLTSWGPQGQLLRRKTALRGKGAGKKNRKK